ncbi:chaperone protein ClpC4, chloroplastic isoform X2 [Helianthus annuus]|uniref:chaperone protein ClpC4, chloroplastic isoform X2 n=1 Tax=Helianthus annuus TaxID=4232 RepID=UPI000B90683A|nr:chaperone protein ClpC4, chloroplastic isoform X2 [Helianthus annuus]
MLSLSHTISRSRVSIPPNRSFSLNPTEDLVGLISRSTGVDLLVPYKPSSPRSAAAYVNPHRFLFRSGFNTDPLLLVLILIVFYSDLVLILVITLHPALERRFQPVKLPEEARELEKEPRQITKEKNKAVCGQDFEKAGELRDWGMDLKTQSSTLMEKNKEMSKAKTEAGEEGPTVTEADIQHIISSDIKNT